MHMSTRLATVIRIHEIYEKLDQQTLVSGELDELVQLSSELYEKALILRFKAAEERVFENKKAVETANEVVGIQEVSEDEIKELEFDIFEPMREIKEIETAVEPEEPVNEPEPLNEPLEERIEIVVEEEKKQQQENND